MIDQRAIAELRLRSQSYLSKIEQSDVVNMGNPFVTRTDMAVEARDMVRQQTGGEIPGVFSQDEQGQFTKVTTVKIQTPDAERAIGKKMGTYVTIEMPDIRFSQKTAKDEAAKFLSSHLQKMLQDFGVGPDDELLIAGLGNWNATPDAIGPLVIGKLLVTRHLRKVMPPEKRGGLRPISAISPGVLGLTGIETAEIIAAVVEKTKPKAVIVVDALAASNINKIGKSLQIGNTGINPGSGVGNRRFGITSMSLGVPVIAVGVPTVVDVGTIVSQAMNAMSSQGNGAAQNVDGNAMRQALSNVLGPQVSSMIVTPKEVDVIVELLSTIIAGGMNTAMHTGLSEDEIYDYLH